MLTEGDGSILNSYEEKSTLNVNSTPFFIGDNSAEQDTKSTNYTSAIKPINRSKSPNESSDTNDESDSELSPTLTTSSAKESSEETDFCETVKSKRRTTNVKGLTLNIPASITTKESNASLPLSPAQERWISMSQGNYSSSEKGDDNVSSATSVGPKKAENEKQDPNMLQNNIQQNLNIYKQLMDCLKPTGENIRPKPRPPQMAPFTADVGVNMNRLYNRHGHVRPQRDPHFFGAQQQQHYQENSRASKSAYAYMHQTGMVSNSQKNAGYPMDPTQSQTSNTISSNPYLLNEIIRRQKIIEAGGKLDTLNNDSSQYMGPSYYNNYSTNYRNMARYASRYYGMEYEPAYYKAQYDGNYMMRLVPMTREECRYWHYGGHAVRSSAQYPTAECTCGVSKMKYQQSKGQCEEGLAPPPRIFESLLPNDNNFSIWLDPKPKNGEENNSKYMKTAVDSETSLLTKMDAIQSEVNAKNFATASPVLPDIQNCDDKSESSESVSSPVTVLSLYELLSNENLIEESAPSSESTKSMFEENTFDFDLLKVNYDGENGRTSENSTTPTTSLICILDKTPGFKDNSKSKKQEEAKKPNEVCEEQERCYFFTTGGTCPFGDACALAHSLDNTII